jgi:tetratricopeptide (TPR) repeat protein
MTRGHVLAAVLSLSMLVEPAASATFEQIVTAARQLAALHRYGEVIDLLSGLEGDVDDPESRYIVAAELGRAYFHLGRYPEAHQRFSRAVTIRPDRAETALYLEASAYLLGDLDQALMILRAILASGARDLYLAVTLPGERQFLAEDSVWATLEARRVSMDLDLDRGSVFGISLGDPRSKVAARVGASPSTADGAALTAEAGPHVVWGFAFDDRDCLHEVVVHVENLVKYTPYRHGIGARDWRTSPAQLIAALGPTSVAADGNDQVVVMSWKREDFTISAAFGHPRPPRPPGLDPGVAMLQLIRLVRNPDAPDL